VSDRIGVGIIGCGRWGQNLIRVFNQLSEASVIICCNKSNHDRLDKLQSAYPHIETTQEVNDVLINSRVDAVAVATPDQTHFDIGRQALRAGKHVFIEKPLALSLLQAKDLIDLAESRGRILMTGHIMQYHPAIQWTRQRLAAGQANPVSILSTRVEFGIAKADADLLWSSVIHDVSMIQYILGSEPEQVYAVGASLNDDRLRDILFVNLIFPGGVVGHIYAGFAGPYRERRLILHANSEIVVFDGLTGSLKLFARRASKSGAESGIREYEKQFEAGRSIDLADMQEPLVVECRHFLECVKTNMIPLSGGENALAVMRTLGKIEKVLRKTNMLRRR